MYLIFGVIEGLIAIRFVLKALGANSAAGFAEFIYGITAPLVAPFYGLFGSPAAQGSVLEIYALVALIVYALIAWLITKMVWIMVGETRSAITTRSRPHRLSPLTSEGDPTLRCRPPRSIRANERRARRLPTG